MPSGSQDFLKKNSYFEGLSDAQLKRLVDFGDVVSFKRGATMAKEADRGEMIFLITKGRVDISVSLVGTDKTESIATIGEGEMVGEMIILGKSRRSANVIAKDEVDVISWRAPDLLQLFENDTQIGYIVMRNIAKHLAERLIAANNVLRNALTLSKSPIF